LTPLSGDGLLELIRKTLFAAGDNDARYILNGLLVTLISTDKKTALRWSARTATAWPWRSRRWAKPEARVSRRKSRRSFPRRPLRNAAPAGRRGDGEPLIGFAKNLMIFRKSGLLLTSRLMEGNYPNYQQVIPKEGGKRISVNRLELESALRRVSVLSRDKASAVKVSFASGKMTLFSSSPDYGEATEEYPRGTRERRSVLDSMPAISWTCSASWTGRA